MTGTRISDMTHLASLPASAARVPVIKDGDTANYAYDLAADLAGKIRHVADRAALALLDHATGLTAYLRESGREGTFVFRTVAQYLAETGRSLTADVTADTDQGILVAPTSDTTGASGAWVRKYVGFWKPEWFGAIGDGTTNDHPAFRSMLAVGTALGFLHFELTQGKTYMVGKQILNSVDEDGVGPYYYAPESAIYAKNLKSLIVRGNGAIMKTNPGMKSGNFNPATGLPLNNTVKTLADIAHPGDIIKTYNTDTVIIEDANFDGNSATHIIGGTTSSNSTEGRHNAIIVDTYKNLRVTGGSIKNFLLDGWYVQQTGLLTTDDPRPARFVNLTVDRCARTCGAILGAPDVVLDNCKFTRPGAAPVSGGGVLGTAPMSALDMENTPNQRILATNCVFAQGPSGLKALSSGGANALSVRFYGCKFVGSINAAAPATDFDKCRIYGLFTHVHGSQATPDLNTKFTNCFITDATDGDTPLQTQATNIFFGNSSTMQGVTFDRCYFDLARLKFNAPEVITNNCTVTVRYDTTQWPNGTSVATLNGTTTGDHTNLKFVEAATGNFPTGPVYLVSTATTAPVRNATITSPNAILQWVSATVGTGYIGTYDNVAGRQAIAALTNAAKTLTTDSPSIEQLDVAITAARTITLPPPTTKITRRFRFVRTANATGAFNLNINTSSAVLLKALATTSTWCEVYSDNGAEYVLTAAGSL